MSHPSQIVWLKSRLGAQISELTVQGDRPLWLDDPSCAYVTLSEQHQLFCVDVAARGRREPLARCPAGQVLFGLDPIGSAAGGVLLLSGVAGSAVWRFPRAALDSLQGERERLAALYDGWVELLLATLPAAPIPDARIAVEAGQTILVEDDRALAARAGQVVWVAPRELRVYLGLTAAEDRVPGGARARAEDAGGCPDRAERVVQAGADAHSSRLLLQRAITTATNSGMLCATGRCWPLTSTHWLQCAPETLRVWSTAQLLAADPNAHFVAELQAFVTVLASRRGADRRSERERRATAARGAERAGLSAALRELAAVDRGERVATAAISGDPLASAHGFIASWLGLPAAVLAPPTGTAVRQLDLGYAQPPRADAARSRRLTSDASMRRDSAGILAAGLHERAVRAREGAAGKPAVDSAGATERAAEAYARAQTALMRATALRARPVKLGARFWEHDAGALLAFSRADGRPVALLPRGRGYQLLDPHDGAARPVDDALAAQLHGEAHQFYRTLPARPLGALELLRFAARAVARDLALVLSIGLAAGLLATSIPLLTGQLFDRIIPGAERGLLIQLLWMLLGCYAGSFLFDGVRGLALLRVQARIDTALEAAIWDRLLRLPLPFFRGYSAGDLTARVLGIGALRDILSDAALTGLLAGVFSLWNVALLCWIDPWLALPALGCVLLAAAGAAGAVYFELQQRRRVSELDGQIRGLLLQLFSGIAKLRAAGAEQRAFFGWARLFARRRDAGLAAEQIGLRVAVAESAFSLSCSLLLYWIASRAAQPLSTGAFLAFNAGFAALLRALLEFIAACRQGLQAIPLYERARPILSSSLESQGASGAALALAGGVEISHVSFRYAKSAPLVLDDVCLRVEPGEFVAIVGASGSGKSSLLRILLGFEAPDEGGVFYEGQALTGLDVRALRQQIGVVLQHSQVMPGDLYSNIVGSTGRTLADAWRAARQACLDQDIEAMPMGMHTVLSAGGGSLSGGQRQRLLIARALAAQPKILLFDEATSALDNRTQAAIRDSLDALRVTRIVIAHRLSTIRNADRIVVMERGRVLEVGPYDALLAAGGAFSRLARRQLV
jgi:NHLM bacteriocin system ABC transporter ATP-binding protein